MKKSFYSAAEACCVGHPDYVADSISDAILQAYYEKDKDSHVACETMVTTDFVLLAGEIKSSAVVDVDKVVRDTIRDIGYTDPTIGFCADTVVIENRLHEQSADIDMGVTKETLEEQGAGDQGFMIGFACNETEHYMPLGITLARALCEKLTAVRESGDSDLLLPDGKAQVVLRNEYDDETDDPVQTFIDTVIVSNQHRDVPIETVREEIMNKVIVPVLEQFGFSKDEVNTFYINPTGKFVIGGPNGDTGLTGRKLVVENYGNAANIGGGASAGKDLSKVDRSAAYFARYIAKNIVAAGLADACQVEISYAIGVAKPTSIHLETFGTNTVEISVLEDTVKEIFDGRPGAICKWLKDGDLDFNKIRRTLAYGNDIYPWEQLDKVSVLQERLK